VRISCVILCKKIHQRVQGVFSLFQFLVCLRYFEIIKHSDNLFWVSVFSIHPDQDLDINKCFGNLLLKNFITNYCMFFKLYVNTWVGMVFKGIVSRDWAGLQMGSLDRS
jgi:hypothetical protein